MAIRYDDVPALLRERLPQLRYLVDGYIDEDGYANLYVMFAEILGTLVRQFEDDSSRERAVADVRVLLDLTELALTMGDGDVRDLFTEVPEWLANEPGVYAASRAFMGPETRNWIDTYVWPAR